MIKQGANGRHFTSEQAECYKFKSLCVWTTWASERKWAINHTDVIFNDKDLPICCGLWAFETPWMSSLNDTDFSNETDLSEIKEDKRGDTNELWQY